HQSPLIIGPSEHHLCSHSLLVSDRLLPGEAALGKSTQCFLQSFLFLQVMVGSLRDAVVSRNSQSKFGEVSIPSSTQQLFVRYSLYTN
ncbi:hypothetical protein LEMLEM_LOCUS25168, partial [Lemmus lemmus]